MRKAKNQVSLAFSLLGLGVLGLVSCGADSVPEESAGASPSIEIVDFDGLEGALASRRGEGMLLNFWAMWCGPCVAELPELLEVAEEFESQGGRVVGISFDLMVPGGDVTTIEEELNAFLVKRGHSFDTLVYDELDYEKINEHFSLPGGIPVTIAIDKDGNVVDREDQAAGKERFEELMRAALGS